MYCKVFLRNMTDLIKQKVVTQQDAFWYESPHILFDRHRLDEFFPNTTMLLTEQLNAAVRLSLYLGIAMTVYKKQIKYLYIPMMTMLFTYAIYYQSQRKTEAFESVVDKSIDDPVMIRPTQNNPFMNVLPGDYLENPNREAVSKLNTYRNPVLEKEIDDKFNYNLYRDVDDVYGKYNSQRQFYTMPVTTIPNEQGKLANWLYQTGPTCKEGNGSQCVANNHRPLKDSKYRNPYFYV